MRKLIFIPAVLAAALGILLRFGVEWGLLFTSWQMILLLILLQGLLFILFARQLRPWAKALCSVGLLAVAVMAFGYVLFVGPSLVTVREPVTGGLFTAKVNSGFLRTQGTVRYYQHSGPFMHGAADTHRTSTMRDPAFFMVDATHIYVNVFFMGAGERFPVGGDVPLHIPADAAFPITVETADAWYRIGEDSLTYIPQNRSPETSLPITPAQRQEIISRLEGQRLAPEGEPALSVQFRDDPHTYTVYAAIVPGDIAAFLWDLVQSAGALSAQAAH